MAIYLVPLLICLTLAVLHRLGVLRLNRTALLISMLGLALFSGLRVDTGPDWQGYSDFFNSINVDQGPIVAYYLRHPSFEVGFFALSYLVKSLGGTYVLVQFLAVTFSTLSLYKLMKPFRVNSYYCLVLYFGYSFLILNFAQVRQSVSIGFFLLGISHYMEHQRLLPAMLIILVGPFFQISSLMYPFLLLAVIFWPRKNRIFISLLIALAVAGAYYLASRQTDFFALASLALRGSSAEDKLEVYKGSQEAQSSAQLLFGAYLVFMVGYFLKFLKGMPQKETFAVRMAIASLVLSIILMLIFPDSYVMYSRAYVAGSIFQGLGVAVIERYRKGWLHVAVFAGSLLISTLSYVRMIGLYPGDYFPYRTILGAAHSGLPPSPPEASRVTSPAPNVDAHRAGSSDGV